MTETPSEQPLPQPQTPIAAVDPSSLEYWCYACDKVVPGETHVDHPGIVCQECENWYIEFIGPPPPLPTSLASYSTDQRRFGKQFLEALLRFSRLAQYEEDPPPPLNQPPSSAIHYAQVFGHHCLYVLRFCSSQVGGDRGIIDPPNQLFRFDVSDLRSRSGPSFTFNPIDEMRAGEQFLHMLRLISRGAREDIVPPNPPSAVVDGGGDQTPFCTPLYSFLLEERTFGGRFLRMLCLITRIARDEVVESPNQLLNDSWDLVEQIIGLYEPENFGEIDDGGQEEVEDDNDHEIDGEEDGDGIEVREEDDDQSASFRGGNLANLSPDDDQSDSFRGDVWGWADIDPEDDHQTASFGGGFRPGIGRYLNSIIRARWAREGVESNLARLSRNIDPDEDQSANFRGEYEEHEVGYEIRDETGGYVGNPGDYLDATAYDTLLQILAENIDGGRAGAPPASKSVVEALETLKIVGECEILECAICQDTVNIGEIAKKLPCGHGYHDDCIVPWLGSRNSCPLCRYELPTDFLDYEEKRKKKVAASTAAESSSRATTSGDGGDDTEDEDGASGGVG